jgi:hypothetical protein
VGRVGNSGLWQLEVLQKYGRFVLDPKVRSILVGGGPGYRRQASAAPVAAGWNYAVSQRAELLDEHAIGPYARSMYFDRQTVAAPTPPWPYR